RLLQLLLGLELLTSRAIPARVLAPVDRLLAAGSHRLAQPAPEGEDAALVQVVRRADEPVVADVEPLPERPEASGDLVRVLLLRQAPLARDLLNVLAVLVRPREHEGVLA